MKKTEPIALIPAAGHATRLRHTPCSKEVLPVFVNSNEHETNPIHVVSECLVRQYKASGIDQILMISRKGKWDIPSYFGSGSDSGLSIFYTFVDETPNVPVSLNAGYPMFRDRNVALGFPDILTTSIAPYSPLLEMINSDDADIALGLYRAGKPSKVDMVSLSENSNVKLIEIKPAETDLTLTWLHAAWNPAFSEFMYHQTKRPQSVTGKDGNELYIGNLFQLAIEKGLRVKGVHFEGERYLDTGTPEDYCTALETAAEYFRPKDSVTPPSP